MTLFTLGRKCAVLAAIALLAGGMGLPAPAAAQGKADQISQINKGVVELETNSAAGMSVRIAEDLANVIDDGATRRVLPVVGKGSQQNLLDLRALRGIDMAILQADVLDAAKKQNPGVENSITYIAKLYNEEFHLLARQNIKSISDLSGQKVNVDTRGGGTAVTTGRIFDLLKVKADLTYDDQEVAMAKLRKGDIAAIAFVAGKPAPIFGGLGLEEGLHFIAIPLRAEITNVYVPTRLTAKDYPDLVPVDQPVDTVAVGAVLAAANLQLLSDRYKNLANFVDAFFTEFQTLLEPGHHPKWREVNLAAELPGWRRFAPADQWLKRNQSAPVAMSGEQLKSVFSKFVDERRQATGGAAMTQQQKDELFSQFERWQNSQASH